MSRMSRITQPQTTAPSRKKRGRKNVFKSRKNRRKEERKAKKAKKNSYYLSKSRKNALKIQPETIAATKSASKPDERKTLENVGSRTKKMTKTRPTGPSQNKKQTTPNSIRKLQFKEANEEDERAIKRLEKLLKLNKRRNKKTLPKSFVEDGLGYVLEVLDRPLGPEGHLSDAESELSDDFARAVGKNNDSDQSDVESDRDDVDSFFDTGKQSQPVPTNLKSILKLNKTQDAPIATETGTVEILSGDEDISQTSTENDQESDLDSDIEVMLSSNKRSSTKSLGLQSLTKARNVEKRGENKHITFDEQLDSESARNELSDSSDGESSQIEDENIQLSDVESIGDESQNLQTLKENNVSKCKRNRPSEDSRNSSDSDAKRTKTNSADEETMSENRDEKSAVSTGYWEDIYGRLRDTKGNVVKSTETDSNLKYVPPAKRAQPANEKKNLQLERLRRQLKGLLNRLSEASVQPISNQIENMYMNNSRNDMNASLVSLVLESVVLKALTPDRLVMEHAMLVALLHANVGTEIGAHFLQSLVKRLDSSITKGGNYGDGKECDNLLLLIIHLFTFKVTNSILIFDILKKFVENFEEKDIELILLTLRSVGFQLRKHNPLALKELIVELQSKAATCQHDQSRLRFMLDTVLAIRNNNMHKIPNYDPSLAEHLKKVLRGFLRKGCYVQELSISMEDLLRSEERGRWWVVGSAWSGKTKQQLVEETKMTAHVVNEKILDLASKQRMNTDVRKTIFCLLMTAEDYMDAFDKLLRLNLKNQQEREIIYVVLDCCLQEKRFNLFYALLLQKLCEFDRRFQMTLQFSLWDKFKELDKLQAKQVTNVAHLLVHLFTNSALPLSALKVIQLAEMDRPLVKFLRQVMLGLLMHDSEETCRKVFARIAPAPKLQMLREGLRLFMRHFLLRNREKLEPDVAEKLALRVEMVEAALLSADKKLRL